MFRLQAFFLSLLLCVNAPWINGGAVPVRNKFNIKMVDKTKTKIKSTKIVSVIDRQRQ